MHHLWWLPLLCGAASLDDRQQFGKFLQQLKRKPTHGEGGIPRLLFTSHRTPRAELPPKLRENVDAWRRLNPSFAFRYFDDAAQSKFMRETCAVPRCLEARRPASPRGQGGPLPHRVSVLRGRVVGRRGSQAGAHRGELRPRVPGEAPARGGAPRHAALHDLGRERPPAAGQDAHDADLERLPQPRAQPGEPPQHVVRHGAVDARADHLPRARRGLRESALRPGPLCGLRWRDEASPVRRARLHRRLPHGPWPSSSFGPFPDFDHKRELRSMNLTPRSLLRTAR